MKRVYGWKPDLPDHRDHMYLVVAPRPLPPVIDLRTFCSPVEDQGQLGSCTANAIAGALELEDNKGKRRLVDYSRLFVYYNERAAEGTIGQDAGALIRDGIKSIAKIGACNETLWPYDVSKFARKPPATCYTDAGGRKIASYTRITSLLALKMCLADGFPVVFGFSVYESFESAAVANSGVLPMPGPHEQLLGGHAVVAVGYDDAHQVLIVRNSWGRKWGQAGYFTMPYAYASDRNLSDDFWTVRK